MDSRFVRDSQGYKNIEPTTPVKLKESPAKFKDTFHMSKYANFVLGS